MINGVPVGVGKGVGSTLEGVEITAGPLSVQFGMVGVGT